MKIKVSDVLKNVVSLLPDLDGDVKPKFRPTPKAKPPRRRHDVQNKSQREDYMKEYMKDYRDQGKDYQKVPDKVKKFRQDQRKRLKDKLDKKTWDTTQAEVS